MNPKSQKITVINYHPTHVLVEFPDSGRQVKLKKQFFQKRVASGFLEITNREKIPLVI